MKMPTTAPPVRLSGVATPLPGPVDSRTCCLRCGRPIPKPRRGQKACSAACRWQLWAAARRAQQEAQAANDEADRAALLLIRAQLDDLLARHEARRQGRR